MRCNVKTPRGCYQEPTFINTALSVKKALRLIETKGYKRRDRYTGTHTPPLEAVAPERFSVAVRPDLTGRPCFRPGQAFAPDPSGM